MCALQQRCPATVQHCAALQQLCSFNVQQLYSSLLSRCGASCRSTFFFLPQCSIVQPCSSFVMALLATTSAATT